jgi:hypothetical protein
MDRTDALRKYQSLRRMTVANGATPAEADTAQGLADRLAARFSFTSADDAQQHTANRFQSAWEDIVRQAQQAAARERARAAQDANARAKAREDVRKAREDAAGRKAREEQQTRDRQWWYDYEAARRTWHWEMRKCGKANCWCKLVDTKAGQGHGPYRYAKKRTGAKVNSVYLGKARAS